MQFEVSRPPGSRLRSLHILCTSCRVPRYQPVEDARVYAVAVPGYLVSGGDGYALIAEEMIKHDSGERSEGAVLVASAEPSPGSSPPPQETWTSRSWPVTSASKSWFFRPWKDGSASTAPVPDWEAARRWSYWDRWCCWGPSEGDVDVQ